MHFSEIFCFWRKNWKRWMIVCLEWPRWIKFESPVKLSLQKFEVRKLISWVNTRDTHSWNSSYNGKFWLFLFVSESKQKENFIVHIEYWSYLVSSKFWVYFLIYAVCGYGPFSLRFFKSSWLSKLWAHLDGHWT